MTTETFMLRQLDDLWYNENTDQLARVTSRPSDERVKEFKNAPDDYVIDKTHSATLEVIVGKGLYIGVKHDELALWENVHDKTCSPRGTALAARYEIWELSQFVHSRLH